MIVDVEEVPAMALLKEKPHSGQKTVSPSRPSTSLFLIG